LGADQRMEILDSSYKRDGTINLQTVLQLLETREITSLASPTSGTMQVVIGHEASLHHRARLDGTIANKWNSSLGECQTRLESDGGGWAKRWSSCTLSHAR